MLHGQHVTAASAAEPTRDMVSPKPLPVEEQSYPGLWYGLRYLTELTKYLGSKQEVSGSGTGRQGWLVAHASRAKRSLALPVQTNTTDAIKMIRSSIEPVTLFTYVCIACCPCQNLAQEISSVYKIFLPNKVHYIKPSNYPELGQKLVLWRVEHVTGFTAITLDSTYHLRRCTNCTDRAGPLKIVYSNSIA